MDKSCFNSNLSLDRPDWSSADLLSSVPKDWLHLGPPCPTTYPMQPYPNFAAGPETLFNDHCDSLSSRADVLTPRQFVSYPIDFQDAQNHCQYSTLFTSKDCYGPPELPSPPSPEWYFPLYAWPSSSPTLVHAPSPYYQPLISFENTTSSQNESRCSSMYPSGVQDSFSGTFQSSPSNGIFGENNIMDNSFASQNQDGCSDFSILPEFKATRANLSFEDIFDSKLCKEDKSNNPNDNMLLMNQCLEQASKNYTQQQREPGNSVESSMLVEQKQVSCLDIVSRTIGVDHAYLGCPSSEYFSGNYHRDRAPSLDQVQASVEFATSAFGESVSSPTDRTQTNLSTSEAVTSGSASFSSCCSTIFWDGESNSRKPSVPFMSILSEFSPTNVLGLEMTAPVSEGPNSPPLSMKSGDNSAVCSMDDAGSKHEKLSAAWTKNAPDDALCFLPIESQSNAVTDTGMKQVPFLRSSWLSTMIDISSDCLSERKNDDVGADSSSTAGHALNSSKTVDLHGLTENAFTMSAAPFTPVEDILYSECHLPMPCEAFSFVSTANAATVSIPEVAKGLPARDNLELLEVSDFIVCGSHETTNSYGFSKSGTAGVWPDRIIEDAIDTSSETGVEFYTNDGLAYSLNMCTVEHAKADSVTSTSNTLASKLKISEASCEPFDCPQDSAGSAQDCSDNLESRNCGSDFLMSAINRHMLVESIQHSSLLLIASHFSGSDNLTESDIQALQSVICNLSRYLVQRAGLSASNIQVASQSHQAPVVTCSENFQKGSKLDRSYFRENDGADCLIQGLEGSSTFSRDRGIGTAEETPNTTLFLAKSAESQRIDPNHEVSRMEEPVGLDKKKQSERTLCKLQKLVDNLRENFASELHERDTAIVLYKNLWSEAQAELASMKLEMKHTKMELESLKQNKYDKDAPAFGVRQDEIPENKGSTSSNSYLEVNFNPKENVWDRAAILLSREKSHDDPDKKMNLNFLMCGTSHADVNESAFQERAAVLLSRERSLGESDISWHMKSCDHDTLQVSPETEISQRGEILARFKVLQECKSHSDAKGRDSCKPVDVGIDDMLGLCNDSLDVKKILMETSADEPSLVSYNSNAGHNRASIQGAELGTNENAYPDTDEVQKRLALLRCREFMQVEIKHDQSIVDSNITEKQRSSPLALEGTRDVIRHTPDAEEFSESQLEISAKRKTRCIEQLLYTTPTNCYLDNNQLIDNSDLGQVNNLSISNQSKLLYRGVPLAGSLTNSSSSVNFIDAFTTDKSSTERNSGSVDVTGEHGKTSFASVLATKSQDPEETNSFMEYHGLSGYYSPEDIVEAESDDVDGLGNILHWQLDHGSVTVSTEGESSSTESDSSWEHLVMEDNIMLH